jgi:4-hydroxybenzoate polyprenyltransferase
LFAFIVTLVREIIKDMEDLKGDNTFGCKTLPIVWGLRKTKNAIYFLTAAFVASVFIIDTLVESLPMNYFALFLFAPIAWLVLSLVRADTKKDFYRLSVLCKVIMLFGVFSMALI